MNDGKLKAVVYCRTSTLDQAREEKVSIPDQIKWAKEFCQEKDYEYAGEYIEPGVTGDIEFESRESASRLLTDAKPLYHPKRKFDLVLVYHSSRLAREADLVLRFHRVLAQNYKIQVYIRNASIEPIENPENYYWGGNYIQQVTAALGGIQDQQENVARSERVRSGFRGLAERGVLTFAPYGYDKVKKFDKEDKYTWSFKLNPQKSLVVQEIFENYAKKGMSIRRIQQSLNERKIPSPNGKVGIEGWSTATIKNILANPVYTGSVRWNRKLGSKYKQGRTTNGKQKRIITPPDKWILKEGVNFPKIIGKGLFDKVQERLKIRGQLKGRAIASEGLFTGIVKCGICRRNCYHKTRRTKKKYKKKVKEYIRSDYLCQTYIRYGKNSCRRYVIAAKKLNEIILHEIDKLIKKAQKKGKLFYTAPEKKKGIWQNKLDLLKKEQDQLQLQAKRLLRVYTTGKINLMEYGEEKEFLDNQIIEKQKQIDELSARLNNQEEIKVAEKRFLALIKNFKEKFDKLDIKRQKDLISNLIESITVGRNGKIDIKYRI